MKTIIILLSVITLNCMGVVVSDNVINAIIMQESSNRNGIIGDPHLKEHSYGVAQIRRQYLEDVNKLYKKDIIQRYGRLLTLEDMRYSPEKSKFVVKCYLSHYGKYYEKRTGMKATPKVLFQIHNGGPNSWNKNKYRKLYAMTSKYSDKVMRYYKS